VAFEHLSNDPAIKGHRGGVELSCESNIEFLGVIVHKCIVTEWLGAVPSLCWKEGATEAK
jgi:hypothetical protein